MLRRKFLRSSLLIGAGLYSRAVQGSMDTCDDVRRWLGDDSHKIPESLLRYYRPKPLSADSLFPYYTQGTFSAYMNKTYRDKDWRPYSCAPKTTIFTADIGEDFTILPAKVEIDMQAWKKKWNEILKDDKSLNGYKENGKLANYLKYIRDNGADKLYISEITILSEHVLRKYEDTDNGSVKVVPYYSYEHIYTIAKFNLSAKTKPYIATRYKRFSKYSRLALCIGISVEKNKSTNDTVEPLVYMLSEPTEVLYRGGCDPIDLDFS